MPTSSRSQAHSDADSSGRPSTTSERGSEAHAHVDWNVHPADVKTAESKNPRQDQVERPCADEAQSKSEPKADLSKDGPVVVRGRAGKNSSAQDDVASQAGSLVQLDVTAPPVLTIAAACAGNEIPEVATVLANGDVQKVSSSVQVESVQGNLSVQGTADDRAPQGPADGQTQRVNAELNSDHRVGAEILFSLKGMTGTDDIKRENPGPSASNDEREIASQFNETASLKAVNDRPETFVPAADNNTVPTAKKVATGPSPVLTPGLISVAPNAGGSDASLPVNPAIHADSRDSQADSQHGQHSLSDMIQSSPVASESASGSATPFTSLVTPAMASQVVDVRTTRTVPGNSARLTDRKGPASDAFGNGEVAGSSGIQVARLIQTMRETEMRVGFHSTEFGDISIRTSVSQQQLQAQISVDHGELRSAIAAHIPAIQSKLENENGLPASIELNQAGLSSHTDGNQSSQRERREFSTSVPVVESGLESRQESTLRAPPPPSWIGGYRLDIRA